MPLHRHRPIAALLWALALLALAACTTPVGSEAGRPAPAPTAPITDLSMDQALTPQAQGLRVRWSGGINAIDAREGGRQCFTLLRATFDARGVLQWPRDAQEFIACGPGDYDRDLVAPFTLISFDGHVVGPQTLRGQPVPVIEIEALYRHSDCVQGNEKHPACYAGYLAPQKP